MLGKKALREIAEKYQAPEWSEQAHEWAKKGITTIYYDRRRGSIEGALTVRTVYDEEIVKNFVRLPCRSGQLNWANQSWGSGAPVPYSFEVLGQKLWLWLTGQKQKNLWANEDPQKIGEFWPISTEPDKATILSPERTRKRQYIGLHHENQYKGSMGCIVTVTETEEQVNKILEARSWLMLLAEYHQKVKLEVL